MRAVSNSPADNQDKRNQQRGKYFPVHSMYFYVEIYTHGGA